MLRAAPPRGSSVTCLAVRVIATVAFVLFSSIASAFAVTVIASPTPLTARVTGRVTSWVAVTRISGFSTVEKPVSSVRTR